MNHQIALFRHTIRLVIMLAPIKNKKKIETILFVCVRGARLMCVY